MINKSQKRRELLKKLAYLLDKSVTNKVFPGGVIGITQWHNTISETLIIPFGNRDYEKGERTGRSTYYDIASLTKPLSTTLSLLRLIEEKKVVFETTLGEIFPCVPSDKKNISIYSLLNHSSGLPGHKPYFEESPAFTGTERPFDVVEKILNEPLEYVPSSKQLYSDLGFILLGKIIENLAQMTLAEFSAKYIYAPLGIEKDIFFGTNKPGSTVYFAPTEHCPWRKEIMCGKVHDDNAYVLGGICGHAGLFSNIDGVMGTVNAIVDSIKGRNTIPSISRENLVRCVSRQSTTGSWGLGFDTPSAFSSSGRFFSKKSFGHLGFTGTSFWVDLEKDISIVLLTNRVNPSRENNKIRRFRPVLHDLIMETLL